MSEPLDYSARLKAKGLDGTGVTEDVAKAMSRTLGKHTILIVEVKHDELVQKADGGRQVKLAATHVQVVTEAQEPVLRRLMAARHHETDPVANGQGVLTGTGEQESSDDVTAELARHINEDGTVWDGSTDGPLDAPEPDPEPVPGELADDDTVGEQEVEDPPADEGETDEFGWAEDEQVPPAKASGGATVVPFSGRTR